MSRFISHLVFRECFSLWRANYSEAGTVGTEIVGRCALDLCDVATHLFNRLHIDFYIHFGIMEQADISSLIQCNLQQLHLLHPVPHTFKEVTILIVNCN